MRFHNDFSNWRAIAYGVQGTQHLLYMGSSLEQVKKNYPGPFYEILDTDEQLSIKRITLEKWQGEPTNGYWTSQDLLKIPNVHKQTNGAK